MNVVKPATSTKPALDQAAALKVLTDSVTELQKEGDVMGLVRIQGLALALADASGGRTRRRSLRVATRASEAADELRRNGTETPEERGTREDLEAEWSVRDATNTLSERFVVLLHLLLGDGSTTTDVMAALRELMMTDDDGYHQVEIPDVLESWSPVLVDGYVETARFFLEGDPGELRQQGDLIQRRLKSVAVGLMTAGAEVRGLTVDVVPLIAYALFTEQLPLLPAATTPEAGEWLDDLLLRMADDVSSMPTKTRQLFVGFFRLAMLIGEAQAYSEHLSLRELSFS